MRAASVQIWLKKTCREVNSPWESLVISKAGSKLENR